MYASGANWSYLFFPPPYNFLAPPLNSRAEDVMQPRGSGMGCSGIGCGGCSGCGGLGQTSTGLFGTGLFVSADPSTWGIGEWAVIGLGGLFAINAVTSAQSAGRGVRKAYRRATA
jgi:hypothetical protein